MKELIQDNELAPHVTVIGVEVQVYEKKVSGELTGRPLSKENIVFSIDGSNRQEAVAKAEEFIKRLKGLKNERQS